MGLTPSDAITASPAWVTRAVHELRSLSERSPPALRRRIEAAMDRLAPAAGGRSLAGMLVRPSATPFVRLIEACAADLGLSGDERVEQIGRSTIFLYLY